MASNAMGAPEYREREVRREATPMGAAYVPGTAAVSPARNAAQWGSIWADLISMFAIFMLLETLATGIGLVSNANGGLSAWITGLVALIAFFVGGWVSGVASVVRGPRAGVLNGLMVWALGTVLVLGLSLFGLSALFGALGSIVGSFFAAGHTIGNLPTLAPGTVISGARAAAWGAFLTLLLTAIVAAIGGWVGDLTGPVGWTRNPE